MSLLKSTVQNFLKHQCTDLAAGLTYYAVFAIFPALLALASLLSVVGESGTVLTTVLDVLRPLVSEQTLTDITPTLRDLTDVQGAPIALGLGTAVALWSASGYVGAFGRAMNRIRDVEETRPFWKLRPLMLLVTLVAVVLNAAALAMIVLTGPIAESVGDEIGLERDVLDLWDLAKWPVLALVVVIVVALLYRATPNERMGFRLITPGAFLALLLWVAASAGFAVYVANFSSYNKTYGSIAGVVVALLWIWLTNVALLFGAVLDATREERARERRMLVEVAEDSAPTAAEPDPSSSDLEKLLVPSAVTSSRRKEKVRVRESFPRKAGEPPYGPITQPIPEED